MARHRVLVPATEVRTLSPLPQQKEVQGGNQMLSEEEINELSKKIKKKVDSLAVGELEHVQEHIKQLVESHIEALNVIKTTN